MLNRVFLIATMSLGLSAPAPAQEKLEWKLKQGDRFFVETVTTKDGTLTVAGKESTVSSVATIVADFTVLKKNQDGSYEIEEEITLLTERSSPSAKGHSAWKLKTGLLPVFTADGTKRQKGATFKIVLQPNGQFQFSGYDQVAQRLAGKNETVLKMVKELMPEEYWRGFVEDIFRVVPSKPVRPGDAWERSCKTGLGPLGSFDASYRYVLKKTSISRADIDVTPAMKYLPPEKPAGGLPFKVIGGAIRAESANGSLVFDVATGRLVRSKMKIHFKGTLTLEADSKKASLQVDEWQEVNTRVLDRHPFKP
jgi:hypothetical protein